MDYLKIGKILNTRGIKGELKIKSLTDFYEDRFSEGNSIFIKYNNNYNEFKVKSFKIINNQHLLVLKDNEDINLVEKYKGSEIFVKEDSDTTLYEDEYHLSEIIDTDIILEGEKVGVVIGVKEFPQGDYLDVLLNSGKHALVPFRDEFIIEVNLEENYIEIVDMEGLL